MALNHKAGAWHTQAGPCPDSREQGRGRGDAVSRVVKTQECGQSHTQLHGSEGRGRDSSWEVLRPVCTASNLHVR